MTNVVCDGVQLAIYVRKFDVAHCCLQDTRQVIQP